MHRIPVLFVIVVSTLLVLWAGDSVAGQEGTPPPDAEEFVLPEGVTGELLAVGVTEAVPVPPTMMELVRFTFAPGAVIHLPEESPSTALVYVEAGTLTARAAAPLIVTRAAVDGQREEIAAGSEFTAGTGDFFIGPAHVSVEARNDETDPLVLLMAVIEPAVEIAGPATPAP